MAGRGRGNGVLRGLPAPLLAYVLLRVWAALAVNLHATMAPGADVAACVPVLLGAWMFGRLVVDVLGVALADKVRAARDRDFLAGLGLALLETGTLLATCAANGWLGGTAALSVAGLLCGLGTELVALLWLEAVSFETFDVARRLVLLDMAVESVLALMCFAPFGLNFVLCMLLPVGSVAGYRAALRRRDDRSTSGRAGTFRLSLRSMAPVGIGVMLLFFGSHFLQNGLTGSFIDAVIGPEASLWSAIAGRWVALAALALLMRFADEMRFECLFAATAILSILGFLVLPLNVAPQSFVAFRVLTIAACFLAGKSVNLVVLSVAGRSNVLPLKLVAAGNLVIYVGHSASILASTAASGAFGAQDMATWLYPVSAVNVVLLAVAGMWLLRDKVINGFLWREAKGEGPSADEGGQAVQAFARAHGLTERETEVLALLLLGRTLPFVAQSLLVSLATVKTHVNHIYQKCGVHNRQDLISLVQDSASSAATF